MALLRHGSRYQKLKLAFVCICISFAYRRMQEEEPHEINSLEFPIGGPSLTIKKQQQKNDP